MEQQCEIRVPTYRRPELLRRALKSLLAQTHRHWRCVVFDDSPDGEGAAVVQELDDDRIMYKPNPRRMGAEGNIDQAFRKASYLGGGYFYVLEDDNYLLPEFLAENLFLCESKQVSVILRNQIIERVHDQVFVEPLEGTLDQWYDEGAYSPPFAWAEMIFRLGISNGSLFWSEHAVSDFEVKTLEVSSAIQENLRAILLNDSFYVAKKPLAVFRGIEAESMRAPLSAASHDWRRTARILQYLRQTALRMIRRYDGTAGVLLDGRLLTDTDEKEAAIYRINRRWPGRPLVTRLTRRLELRAKAVMLEALYDVPSSVKQQAAVALHRAGRSSTLCNGVQR